MTITVQILVSDGIVLAADSRQVREILGQLRVDSDNADKIFQLGSHLAVCIYGQGDFYSNDHDSPRSIGSILRTLATSLPNEANVQEVATTLHQKLRHALQTHRDVTGAGQTRLGFHVAGYDPGSDVGKLYRCELPGEVVQERDTTDAGAVWSGQREIISRLILGYDPRLREFLSLAENEPINERAIRKELQKLQLYLNFQTMRLQDAIDLAVCLVRATIDLLRFSSGIVGAPRYLSACGGAIDVAVITPAEGFCWLQRKTLQVRGG